jgi:hypothetical protein
VTFFPAGELLAEDPSRGCGGVELDWLLELVAGASLFGLGSVMFMRGDGRGAGAGATTVDILDSHSERWHGQKKGRASGQRRIKYVNIL